MTLTNFPDGITSFGVPQIGGNLPLVPGGGDYWFVDSATGSSSYPGTYDQPFASLATAISAASANDIIVLAAGHAETIIAAGGVTVNKAGLQIIGEGVGNKRPIFTFGTSTAASFLITAASVSVRNIIGLAAIDALTNPFHVQAAACTLDIEWQDASSTVEAARAVLTTAAADKLSVNLKYIGFPAGNATVNAVRLVGGNDVTISVDAYGIFSTAVVEMITTACTNVNVRGYMYNSGTTNFSKSVVDTVTGSTWFAAFYDGAAAAFASGGSGGAIASDDVATVNTNVTTLMGSTVRTIVKTDGAVLAGADPLFTITGGPIKVVSIIGRVTTAIVSTANGTLQATTTVPASTTAMSTTVAIDDDAAGTVYTFVGPTGVLTPTTAGLVIMDYGSTTLTPSQYIVPPGNINFLGSAARVGVIEWSMEYVPLSPSAVVTAAA